ncbi:MAG: hypothetical protein GY925_16995 [Actinomycetia bacterium]|nr:hypothetical protein [Actinomycetes bacterium]
MTAVSRLMRDGAGILVHLLAGAVVVWATMHGLLRDLSGRYFGPVDADQNIWFGWRFGRELRVWNLVPRRFDDVVVPIGFDVFLVDGFLPLWFTGLLNLVFGPILSYNLALASIAVANYAAMFALARTITASRGVAASAAVLGAMSPVIATRFTGHIQLACVFSAALLMREAMLCFAGDESNGQVRPVRLGALSVLAYLCSIYFLMGGLALFAIVGLVERRSSWRNLGRIAFAGTAVVIVLSPAVIARVQLERAERLARSDAVENLREDFYASSTSAYSADFFSVAVPNDPTLVEATTFRPVTFPRTGETLSFPGYPILIAIVAGVFRATRQRWLIAWTSGAVLIATLGPILRFNGRRVVPFGSDAGYLPYEIIRRLPVLDAMRAPGRFALLLPVVGVVAIAALLPRLLDALPGDHGRRRLAISALACLTVLLSLPSILHLNSIAGLGLNTAGGTIAAFADDDAEAFMVVPTDCTGVEVMYLHVQIEAEQPMVGCGPQFQAIPWFSEVHVYASDRAMRTLSCTPSSFGLYGSRAPLDDSTIDQDLDRLARQFGVRFLLVDEWQLANPACTDVAAAMAELRVSHHAEPAGQRFTLLDLGSFGG